jgi:hypothetical protein
MCRRCPVSSECLSAALEDPATYGTWAGTSRKGRAAMRKAAAEFPDVIPVRRKRRLAG